MSRKLLGSVLILSMLFLALPVYGQGGEGAVCFSETDLDFLEDNGYAFSGDVAQVAFVETIAGIAGEVAYPEEIDAEGFSTLEALLTTVYFVNVDELGFTYPEDKVAAALEGWHAGALPMERQQELAAAIDVGLLDESCQGLDFEAEVDAALANYLAYKTLIFTGQYKHFLGYSTDADIYNKVIFTWNSFDQVLMPDFQIPANEMIRNGLITGYNVKRPALNARFDPDRTIVYGHSDIAHAIQLIGLLRSENLEAKVLLEPKTSAFLYLAEWGEPSQSPSFQVELWEDGNGIAYAKEYDLAFEFDNVEDMLRFDDVIKDYAKKDAADEPGLIIASWWQPLYSARIPVEDYVAVKNNVALGEGVYIQSFSLVETSEAIVAAFAEAYPDTEIVTWDLWVNVAFHRYLLGEPE